MKISHRRTRRYKFIESWPVSLIQTFIYNDQSVFYMCKCARTNNRRGDTRLIFDPQQRQLRSRESTLLSHPAHCLTHLYSALSNSRLTHFFIPMLSTRTIWIAASPAIPTCQNTHRQWRPWDDRQT